MGKSFAQALEQNPLPKRLGDVSLEVAQTMWVGRADRPPRSRWVNVAWLTGLAFIAATVVALLSRADHLSVALFLLPAVAAFAAATWLDGRERRQRAFAFDFSEQVLRLDFSSAISGMPRTVRLPFDQVQEVELAEQSDQRRVLTIDFKQGAGIYREVLVANVSAAEALAAERVRKLLRAAVGLEPPPSPGPQAPPVLDTFG